ncbi:MAG: tripartite tricarboxylate transporter TctB family protein [Ruminococcaceae bacterium]|nr:tripartite tricarboxylate transporter TctB family protein [Oscillospiraceae bacterium]
MENERRRFDFLSSIIMFALSVYVILAGIGIYHKAGKLFYVSPALVPTMLGFMLCLLSVILFLSSIKDGGISVRIAEVKNYFSGILKDKNTMRMLIGVLLMALYTFVLLDLLPFWLSTFLFMLLLMFFLDAGSLTKILVITVLCSALIVLLFQVCFRVPLP